MMMLLVSVVSRRHPWVPRLVAVVSMMLLVAKNRLLVSESYRLITESCRLVAEDLLPEVQVPDIHLPLLRSLMGSVLMLPRPGIALVSVETGLLRLRRRSFNHSKIRDTN
jgi:hypothetical protein